MWVLGGEDLPAGADPRGAHEVADRPAGAGLDRLADHHRGEHDAQVGFDGFTFLVVDGRAARSCLDMRKECSIYRS